MLATNEHSQSDSDGKMQLSSNNASVLWKFENSTLVDMGKKKNCVTIYSYCCATGPKAF